MEAREFGRVGIAVTVAEVNRQRRIEDRSRRQTWPAADVESILRYGAFVGSAIECHPVLDRAMERARTHIAAMEQGGRSVYNGTVILADRLERSKGRFDRTWHAPAGGLWGCLLHVNTLLPQSRNLISLAVGVACCEAVREMGIAAELRWVNDVLVGDRKVAGFLIESFFSPRYREEYNLIGFGININNRHFPHELQDTALSLAQALGRPLDISAFARLFLAKLSFALGLLYYEEEQGRYDDGGWEVEDHRLLRCWRELATTVGRRVVFGFNVMQAPQYQATVSGISGSGGLVMVLDDGHEKTEYSGEIRYV
ncbi:biotin--[acetyl-CoA-carboxylase] ligase [Desulfoprunum benzoelyticum]|uniref:BirA family biotin operon repressor/biotin-[acetyl-CoA-carboxylase] ligase n=1 Tax=Desulfoprunum benzoelyticum TaxID=1506996 RepID=A0A840UU04_9BACT|nr:biotin--[acetyl-CoA-carboxylase] ligase [Desulfoprunum benzoelyticum]MBB5349165.1 BirA family biotin operon repressor/biotin-[acetyl-CoA-carboxylase] ligase [Desulfoprunum benzoelyticum]MBM9530598.1 biotin--[acetyl-CoA-carboxylase] ligase [Desulfoprunum benzoelyticum]